MLQDRHRPCVLATRHRRLATRDNRTSEACCISAPRGGKAGPMSAKSGSTPRGQTAPRQSSTNSGRHLGRSTAEVNYLRSACASAGAHNRSLAPPHWPFRLPRRAELALRHVPVDGREEGRSGVSLSTSKMRFAKRRGMADEPELVATTRGGAVGFRGHLHNIGLPWPGSGEARSPGERVARKPYLRIPTTSGTQRFTTRPSRRQHCHTTWPKFDVSS